MCRIWCNFAIEAAHVPCASCSEIQLCLVQVEKELSILPDHCALPCIQLCMFTDMPL